MVFPVVMYGCESWTIKKAEHWRIDAFELWCWRRLLRVPWTARQSKTVHPKAKQSWIFMTFSLRTEAEAETPLLWPPDVKNWLIGKGPDAGKDWRQEEKEMTEDEMVGWHHWLDGHEFERDSEFGDGQGSLACCNPQSCKETDTADRLNWTKLNLGVNMGKSTTPSRPGPNGSSWVTVGDTGICSLLNPILGRGWCWLSPDNFSPISHRLSPCVSGFL